MPKLLSTLLLAALGAVATVHAAARQGGDIIACQVTVNEPSGTYWVSPSSVELGDDGEEICRAFLVDVMRGVGADESSAAVNIEGTGQSIEKPANVGAHIDDVNPMIAIVRHYRANARGQVVLVDLIARANDQYAVRIATASSDSERFYQYSEWVRRRLTP